MINAALRFYDSHQISSRTLERNIFSGLQELSIRASLAVIPIEPCEHVPIPIYKKDVSHLLESQAIGSIEIAQQGYSHQCLNQTKTGKGMELDKASKPF